jgi:hypothetical protein
MRHLTEVPQPLQAAFIKRSEGRSDPFIICSGSDGMMVLSATAAPSTPDKLDDSRRRNSITDIDAWIEREATDTELLQLLKVGKSPAP